MHNDTRYESMNAKTKFTRALFLAGACALFAARAAPARAETSTPSSAPYVVDASRSSLDISGHDSVLGNHTLTFDRWSAKIDGGTLPARLVFDIDLASIRSSEPMVKSIVANHMLEVAKYPHATFVATLSPTNTPGVITIDGSATIHGHTNPLHLTGQLRQEGAGYRFDASIDISRKAYDLTYAPAEAVLDDKFVVTVSALAVPEP
jgi:polyisoprenoid-binding protein YceI